PPECASCACTCPKSYKSSYSQENRLPIPFRHDKGPALSLVDRTYHSRAISATDELRRQRCRWMRHRWEGMSTTGTPSNTRGRGCHTRRSAGGADLECKRG